MVIACHESGAFDVRLRRRALFEKRTTEQWEPLLVLRYEEGHDQCVVSMDQLRFLRPRFLDASTLKAPPESGPTPGGGPQAPRAAGLRRRIGDPCGSMVRALLAKRTTTLALLLRRLRRARLIRLVRGVARHGALIHGWTSAALSQVICTLSL